MWYSVPHFVGQNSVFRQIIFVFESLPVDVHHDREEKRDANTVHTSEEISQFAQMLVIPEEGHIVFVPEQRRFNPGH